MAQKSLDSNPSVLSESHHSSDQVVVTQQQNLVTNSDTNRVNFYTLVQNALSQLPNGRGSLDEITGLVRQNPILQATNCDSASLLKKTALALTHFQKGAMAPLIVYDPTTQQFVVMPTKQQQGNVVAKPANPIGQHQQKPVKPQQQQQQQNSIQQDHIPTPQPVAAAATTGQSVNAGQSVVVQQRNVSFIFNLGFEFSYLYVLKSKLSICHPI
jgi:hypothetical protein